MYLVAFEITILAIIHKEIFYLTIPNLPNTSSLGRFLESFPINRFRLDTVIYWCLIPQLNPTSAKQKPSERICLKKITPRVMHLTIHLQKIH